MGMGKLLQDTRRLGLRSTLDVFRRNLRMYGWRSTLRKMAGRFVAIDSLYRHLLKGLERSGTASVTSAQQLYGRPSVLITGSLDLPQCKKYRVLQKVDFCEQQGWACHYSSYLDEARVLNYLQVATALVLYRVPDTPQVTHYLSEARRLGVPVYYDIDDPIFDGDVYRENRNLDHIAPQERAAILDSVPNFQSVMERSDALVVSTRKLADLAEKKFDKPVYVWRNLVDPATLGIVENLADNNAESSPGQVVIGYASGSRAHDADFEVMQQALLEILATCPQTVFRVIGYAQLPDEFAAFGARIERRPFSSYQQYLQSLKDIDIAVVPLLDDRFNACKSAIRYLEAALCGTVVIASPVGQFEEVIKSGVDGFLAKDSEAWRRALQTLIESESTRESVSLEANSNVLANHVLATPGAVDPALIASLECP